jgi:hypothetical protein
MVNSEGFLKFRAGVLLVRINNYIYATLGREVDYIHTSVAIPEDGRQTGSLDDMPKLAIIIRSCWYHPNLSRPRKSSAIHYTLIASHSSCCSPFQPLLQQRWYLFRIQNIG